MNSGHNGEVVAALIPNREKFFSAVLSALPGLVSYVDPDLNYLYANDAYGAWFGVSPAQCVGRPMKDIMGQAALESVMPQLSAALSGSEQKFERLVSYKHGGTRFISIHYIPDKNSSGKVIGIIALVNDVTTVKEQQENQKLLFDTMNDGLVVQNASGAIIEVNPAALSILDLTEDQIFGRTSMDPRWNAIKEDGSPFSGEQHPAIVALRTGLKSSGTLMGLNLPGGGLRWINITATPYIGKIKVPNPLPDISPDQCVITTFSDVTEIIAARAHLQDQFDLSPDLICIAAPDGTFVKVNQSFNRILGYADTEMLKRPLLDFVHPEDRKKTLNEMSHLQKGKVTLHFENRYRSKNGDYILLSWVAQTEPKTGSVFAIARDITEKRRIEDKFRGEIEAALELSRNNERLFREVFDNVPVGIIKLDADYNFITVNKAYASILGYEEKELIGTSVLDITCPEDKVHSMESIDRMAKPNSGVYRFEKRYFHKTGRIVIVRVTSYVLENEKSPVVLSVVEAITDAKRIESELIEARDRALAASSARTQFLTNMSHEIRTPLNGILGNLELLKSDSLTAEQQKITSDALYSGRTLLGLLNDILDFSKIDAGHLRLEAARLNLREVVQSVHGTYGLIFKEKGVDLVVEVESGVPTWVVGDSLRIRQILNNLVSNALKFTSKGRVIVSVGTAGADKIKILIQDTGIGISEENIKRLFKPFVQADERTTRDHGGTGLGLSISQQLAKMMGGEISLTSVLGQGTSFTVVLTLKATGAPASYDAKDSDQNIDCAPGLRILVAEDNAVNQTLLKRILQKCGHTFTMTGNGQEAIDALRESTYDAILMDCQMPVMDGFDATKKIIEIFGDKRPRIIALTANAFIEDRQKCMASGMDYYLSKPVSIQELNKVFNEVSKRKASTS